MTACIQNRLKWLVFCSILVVASSSSSPPPRRRPAARRLFPFCHHARQQQQHDEEHDEDMHPTTNENEQTQEPQTIIPNEEEPLLPRTTPDARDDDNHSSHHHHHHHHGSLLQVSCTLQVATPATTTSSTPLHPYKQHAVTTIVDTGAQVTVMSFQAAQTCGISHLIDLRYAGHATGVGSCRVVGRIPAGALLLTFGGTSTQISSPAITVLEPNDDEFLEDVHLLLGLDFLQEYKAILSLPQECMILTVNDGEEPTVIPFVQQPLQQQQQDGDSKLDYSSDVGWINKDILASLKRESSQEDDCYSDNDDDDDDGRDEDDEDYDLDMSGV